MPDARDAQAAGATDIRARWAAEDEHARVGERRSEMPDFSLALLACDAVKHELALALREPRRVLRPLGHDLQHHEPKECHRQPFQMTVDVLGELLHRCVAPLRFPPYCHQDNRVKISCETPS